MSKEKKMEELFNLTADRLIEAVSNPDTATPGMLQCALRMLNDNQASDDLPVVGSRMHELADSLPFKKADSA